MSVRMVFDSQATAILVTGDVETTLRVPDDWHLASTYVTADTGAVVRLAPSGQLHWFQRGEIQVEDADGVTMKGTIAELTVTRSPPPVVLEPISVSLVEEWARFDASLVWLPISDYDRRRAPWVVVAHGEQRVLAFRGDLPDDPFYTDAELDEERDPFTPGNLWRHAQDSMMWTPLGFEPERFADISDDWQARLAED